MLNDDRPCSGGDVVVRGLLDRGVKQVFGYPGGPLMPLYDALYREPRMRHILARDEQAAGFMADGFARATGEVGVFLAVCGPGVFNAATPLANAFTDSVPIMLVSGQVPTSGRGLRSGCYHENDQLSACATFTKWRGCADRVDNILLMLDAALASVGDRRPGPAFLEIPVDVLGGELPRMPSPMDSTILAPPLAASADIASLADLVGKWQKPIILAGGGVVSARVETLLFQLAERLGAPVFHTLMGKGVFPEDHPLSCGLPWREATSDLSEMAEFVSPLFSEADGLLAVGCRFSQVSTASWTLPKVPSVAHIDVDKTELGRHYPVTLGIHADARQALRGLLSTLAAEKKSAWAARPARPAWRLPGLDLIGPMRRVLPRDAIIAADVTSLAYVMLAEFPVYQPRTFLHPAGFISMGYAIPAALGAKTAFPDRTVVAVVGDGGFMMSGMELATAMQEKLPIVIVLINDGCLSLIKGIQARRFEGRTIGVDLLDPDFGMFARAFGVCHWSVRDDASFETALKEAVASREPALVEVRVG